MATEVMHPSVVDPVTGDTDPFYIRTPTSLADDRHLVLKQGETFIVLDRRGDIRPVGLAQDGLYFGAHGSCRGWPCGSARTRRCS